MRKSDDDPSNVRPTVLKVPEEKPSKENLTMKRGSHDLGAHKDKMSNLKINLSPGPKTPGAEVPARSPSPLKEYPLLKLNEYAKNCSQADSADSNCDFVKKVVYNSENVSSVSTTVDSQTGKQASMKQATPILRTSPAVVRGQGASKEKKERPTKRDTANKANKEKEGEGVKKNELETTSKGRGKERNSKHANKEHKRASKTDKGGKRHKKKG